MSKPAPAPKPAAAPAKAASAPKQPGKRPAAARAPHDKGKSAPGKPQARRRSKSSIPRVPFSVLANPELRLQIAITVSVLIHGILLLVHFTFPDAFTIKHRDQSLEVVLVNSKSATKPKDATKLAQNNLDGGGNTDENRSAKTPLPASPQKHEGDSLVEAQRRQQQLEAMQQKLLTQQRAKIAVIEEQQRTTEQPDTPNTVSGRDLADRALAIAKLEAQIDQQIDEYQKRPRKKFFGARVSEYAAAQYIENWRQKIERVGTLNYPPAARGKHYGSLLLYVEIDAKGNVINAEVQRSSGNKILDEAALRIVHLSAPFPAFTPEMRAKMDILAFARRWTFTNEDTLATSSGN